MLYHICTRTWHAILINKLPRDITSSNHVVMQGLLCMLRGPCSSVNAICPTRISSAILFGYLYQLSYEEIVTLDFRQLCNFQFSDEKTIALYRAQITNKNKSDTTCPLSDRGSFSSSVLIPFIGSRMRRYIYSIFAE